MKKERLKSYQGKAVSRSRRIQLRSFAQVSNIRLEVSQGVLHASIAHGPTAPVEVLVHPARRTLRNHATPTRNEIHAVDSVRIGSCAPAQSRSQNDVVVSDPHSASFRIPVMQNRPYDSDGSGIIPSGFSSRSPRLGSIRRRVATRHCERLGLVDRKAPTGLFCDPATG
jgi:hypothetical protein